MKIMKIKSSLIKKYSEDTEMLHKEDRPCVLVVRLKYKNKLHDFAVPIRSNIPAASPKNEFFPLATRYSTRDKNRHGIHYIKMFPVDKRFYDKYRTEDNVSAALIKAMVSDKENEKRIVKECQEYLDRYEAGDKPKYSTDIDLLISILESI
jgi:hypothetical protein